VSAEIVKFEPVEIGEAYRFEPDTILDEAKGKPFAKMAVIGQLEDGTLWVTGNANAGETMILMERIKHSLIFPDD